MQGNSPLWFNVICLLYLEGTGGWHHEYVFSSRSIRYTVKLAEYFKASQQKLYGKQKKNIWKVTEVYFLRPTYDPPLNH